MSSPSPTASNHSPLFFKTEELPANVQLGPGSIVTRNVCSFRRFRSKCAPGLCVGAQTTIDGVHFNVGSAGRISIGDFCYLQEAMLLCEAEIVCGNHVFIGWHATVADSDFHPIDPAERMQDVIACSAAGMREGLARPAFKKAPVVIEDDVYIGPRALVLKGVRIGAGAVIEPGAVVVKDVPAGVRLRGNPAVPVVDTVA